jgi:hypothetical protein
LGGDGAIPVCFIVALHITAIVAKVAIGAKVAKDVGSWMLDVGSWKLDVGS